MLCIIRYREEESRSKSIYKKESGRGGRVYIMTDSAGSG